MNQVKLWRQMLQDILMDAAGPYKLYSIAEYWVLAIGKYQAFVLPTGDKEFDVTQIVSDIPENRTMDSNVHHRIDNTLNGSDLVCIGMMTVSVNMLRQKVLVLRDDFGIVYLIRWTKTAEMLARDKSLRCKRYQDLVVWWSADDDFPIYAGCEIAPVKVRGIAK